MMLRKKSGYMLEFTSLKEFEVSCLKNRFDFYEEEKQELYD